jgi:hypothetical protein
VKARAAVVQGGFVAAVGSIPVVVDGAVGTAG